MGGRRPASASTGGLSVQVQFPSASTGVAHAVVHPAARFSRAWQIMARPLEHACVDQPASCLRAGVAVAKEWRRARRAYDRSFRIATASVWSSRRTRVGVLEARALASGNLVPPCRRASACVRPPMAPSTRTKPSRPKRGSEQRRVAHGTLSTPAGAPTSTPLRRVEALLLEPSGAWHRLGIGGGVAVASRSSKTRRVQHKRRPKLMISITGDADDHARASASSIWLVRSRFVIVPRARRHTRHVVEHVPLRSLRRAKRNSWTPARRWVHFHLELECCAPPRAFHQVHAAVHPAVSIRADVLVRLLAAHVLVDLLHRLLHRLDDAAVRVVAENAGGRRDPGPAVASSRRPRRAGRTLQTRRRSARASFRRRSATTARGETGGPRGRRGGAAAVPACAKVLSGGGRRFR